MHLISHLWRAVLSVARFDNVAADWIYIVRLNDLLYRACFVRTTAECMHNSVCNIVTMMQKVGKNIIIWRRYVNNKKCLNDDSCTHHIMHVSRGSLHQDFFDCMLYTSRQALACQPPHHLCSKRIHQCLPCLLCINPTCEKIKQLLLFQITDSAAVCALDIISNDLQVGFDIDRCLG